ncbi:hypothetical protein AFEL58S_03225 [Afipia felis]
MQQPGSIIAELEDAVKNGSSEKRVNTLRRVTDLFLHNCERLNEEQIKVFDDVLCLLTARIEIRAKAELSQRLAAVDYAPHDIIQRLACDDEIAVAEDTLVRSSQIDSATLVDIARTKSQDHLFAISGRDNLSRDVTDVIVDRGERRVICRLAGNATAEFSEAGYAGMVAHAEADDELTEILGLRADLPIDCLRRLLQRATEAVLARLMAIAPPEIQGEVSRVLKSIAAAVGVAPQSMRDFSQAEAIVRRMKGLNELNDAAIISFSESRRFDEIIAALAILTNMPCATIEKVIDGPRADLVLIPCKSARLNWPAARAILAHRQVKPKIDERTLEVAARDYDRLSPDTADRTLRFWQVRGAIEK